MLRSLWSHPKLTGLALLLAAPAFAAGSLPIDTTDSVRLAGHVHPLVATATIVGEVAPDLAMARMILALKPAPEALARREAFLARLQDPASPDYHHWLSPAQFGERFGPSSAEVERAVSWLKGQGFRVDSVSPSRLSVTFSGDAAQVKQAFKTSISTLQVEGATYVANVSDPWIPRTLQGLVGGVVSMHNIPRQAFNNGFRRLSSEESTRILNSGSVGNYTGSKSGAHYLSPGDFATIYNLKPLYTQGIDGTGVVIGIAGRCDVDPHDVVAFRRTFKLPADRFATTYNGDNPGITDGGEEGEADLDVQWSGAVAPGATVNFVVTASTNASDGIDLSNQFIVDHNFASVVSVSFGAGESGIGPAGCEFYRNLWAQAAAQGITVCVSSGDSGAAGNNGGGASLGWGRAINGLGSSPNNICVGGTQFDEGTGTYWNATNAPDYSSVVGYIPETAWNESGLMAGGSGLWAGGGGISTVHARPDWQSLPGVPSSTNRCVPDVALTAAIHDGFLYSQGGGIGVVGGTSASSPAFAGIMALIVQKTGQRQGNANIPLYAMGSAQYTASGPAVFHDVTTGSNSVPGTIGFDAGSGYDAATGLGSVDGSALAAAWPVVAKNTLKATITSPANPETAVFDGGSVTFTASATDSDPAATLTYLWTFGDGTFGTGPTVTHTYSAAGTGPRTCPVTLTVMDATGSQAASTAQVGVRSFDMNGDGKIAFLDLLRWVIFKTEGGLDADLNMDGVVDDQDLKLLLGALDRN